MKKIGFLVYDYSKRGGLNEVVKNLSNELVDSYEIHIMSLIQEKENPYYMDERIKYKAFSKKEERLRQMRRSLKRPLAQYVKDHKLDIVILEGDYPGFIGSSLRFTSKAQIIFHEHGSLMSQWDRKDIVFIRFISSFFAHKTVVLTQRNKEAYKKKFLKQSSKIYVVPNWVEGDLNLRHEYKIDSKKIIYAGRLASEKGIIRLLEAWKLVKDKLRGWSLDLYGDGEEKQNIENFIAANNLSNSVNLNGWVDGVSDLYPDYSFFVLPSEREGFPLVILEAQSQGLPVISFDILTGPAEIINHKIDGLLIEEKNVAQFGDAILLLAENYELRKSMSKKAKENSKKFSKERILNLWTKILK